MKKTLLFNDLLKMADLNPDNFKIYRHKDRSKEYELGSPLYLKWLSDIKEFEDYQRYQGTNHFTRDYLASFIVTPSNETLFIGIYKVQGTEEIKNSEDRKLFFYDLERTEYLEELIGRVVIGWDHVYKSRQTCLRAENYNFEVLKIKNTSEEPFPGFHDFLWDIRKINELPSSWKDYLKHTKGIYLLSCGKTNKLYIGSAYGEDGFLGRWKNYLDTDDGGNKLLIEHNKKCDLGYQVSILEVVASTDSRDEIIRKESTWKEKLLTRDSSYGLNAN